MAGKSLVPLYLISEPLSYTGCDWKSPSTANNTLKKNTKEKRDDEQPSSKEPKIVAPTTTPNTSSKPKGLREFLTKFGTNYTANSPLFPDREELTTDSQEKKSSNTPSKTNAFFQKLKQPSAESIVKSLTGYVTNKST